MKRKKEEKTAQGGEKDFRKAKAVSRDGGKYETRKIRAGKGHNGGKNEGRGKTS